MGFLRWVLRVYSWIFEALLCLLAIGVAIVSLTIGVSDPVSLDWLPFSAAMLPAWLVGLGVLGLAFVILALMGRLRVLLFLFAIGVFVLVAKGLFFSTHTFENAAGARNALLFVIGALIAAIGAWPAGPRRRATTTP